MITYNGATLSKYNFKPGDIIQHIQLTDAIGIITERDYDIHISDGIHECWKVFWINHPDEYAVNYIYSKWIKPFRGYRKRKKKVDKSDSK